MNAITNLITFLCILSLNFAEEIRLLNLDPPEAQQYIDRQDTNLKYAPKIDSNVPAVRFLGNEPHNVVEDIYLANQYHGQDGIGGYLYGYSVPDIAKTEKKKAGGDLRGAYNYITGNGQEIKVEYWDDGTGFHQVDNVPKILPKQIEDTPEVKAAKEEHQRIWNEQAERNSRPIENPFDQHFNYVQGPQQQTQAQQLVNQYQQQKHQFPNPGQSIHYEGEQGGQYQPSQNVNKYQQPGNQIGQYRGNKPAGGFGVSGQSSLSSQYGGGQLGGNRPSGQFGRSHTSAGQFNTIQPTGQLSGSPSPSGQFGGSQSAAGQYGGSHLSSQSITGGQLGASRPSSNGGSQSLGSGQYSGGQSLGSEQYGGGFETATGQYGADQSSSSGHHGASGQYGGLLASSQGSPSGQYGPASRSGQYGSSHLSASGQYDGEQLSGGYFAQASEQNGQYSEGDEGQYKEGEEEKGPPKGFFYSFDYPVGIIVQKDGGVVKREGNLKDIYSANKANFEKQLQQGSGSATGYLVA